MDDIQHIKQGMAGFNSVRLRICVCVCVRVCMYVCVGSNIWKNKRHHLLTDIVFIWLNNGIHVSHNGWTEAKQHYRNVSVDSLTITIWWMKEQQCSRWQRPLCVCEQHASFAISSSSSFSSSLTECHGKWWRKKNNPSTCVNKRTNRPNKRERWEWKQNGKKRSEGMK